LRDRVRQTLETEGPEVLATVGQVKIYGDEHRVACIAGDLLIVGAPLELVRETVERLNVPEKPGLAQLERFRRARAAFDAKAPVFVHFDLQNFREDYLEAWANDRDVPAVDALFDVKTIDCISGVARLIDGRALAEVSAFFNAPNGFYHALRTRAQARSVHRFYATGYTQVLTCTLTDGAEQWRLFSTQMAKFFEGMKRNNMFAEGMGQIEESLGTKIADELSNVTEFGMGMRFDPEKQRGMPELLFALKFKDADRMRKLMTKLEEAARGGGELTVREKETEDVKVRYLDEQEADSDYAYAFVEGYVVASNRLRAVEDAVRTWKSGKCVLDDEAVKKALTGLHEPNAKLMIMDFAKGPFMRRGNQQPAIATATTVEHDLRIDARGDIDGILRILGYEMRILRPMPRGAAGNVPREAN
ncbi:MAG TPA: DUF3352 domain-containing protein, partial [Planctomycetota bacterium]|nr:DUF3352 domain-containing protein [Planctomycetota bacterium]